MPSVSEKPIKAARPQLRSAQRWNVVWVVPILAVLIGGWMLYQSYSTKGPEVRIRFETADGIVAGKTEIRCRSVRVGVVSRLELSDDLQSVLLFCRMDQGSEHLLRKGTRFWVVRPRVSTSDISGLGTLLTGAYIELDPGTGALGPRRWKGRETPPATKRSIPGRRITLVSEEAGSMMPGSPIYYRGFEVGRIESSRLDTEMRRVIYEAFVQEGYQNLVRVNSKFWNTSGIELTAGVDGFKLRTPSFQAMFAGGVSFAVQDGVEPGGLAVDGTEFALHPDAASADSSTFEPTIRLLLLFDQSVRGLVTGAPVEFRGIKIGRVSNISFDYVQDPGNRSVPVLVEIDPKLLGAEVANPEEIDDVTLLREAVGDGLRATLRTGSLITGALFVDLDYYSDASVATLGEIGGFQVVPTMPSGFAQLEVKLAAILDKFEKLPLEVAIEQITLAAAESAETIAEARKTLKEIEEVAAAAKVTLEDPAIRGLPDDLRETLAALEKSVSSVGPDGAVQGDLLRTLDELRGTLRAMKSLTTTIDEKPNSLLFGRDSSGNPRPRAAR